MDKRSGRKTCKPQGFGEWQAPCGRRSRRSIRYGFESKPACRSRDRGCLSGAAAMRDVRRSISGSGGADGSCRKRAKTISTLKQPLFYGRRVIRLRCRRIFGEHALAAASTARCWAWHKSETIYWTWAALTGKLTGSDIKQNPSPGGY